MKTYEEFIATHPKGHFMQTREWAKVKCDWKSEIITVKGDDGEICGSMNVLIRKLPVVPYTLMYSPRAPVCDVGDEKTLSELTQAVRELAKREKAYALKIDPDVKSENAEFKEIMSKLGYKIKSTKNFEGIQPNYVFRLDVSGKTEDEVMNMFHSKTRYNIRVAQKNGVETAIGNRDDLARFHEIMVETGARDDFVIRSLDYFQRMYDELGSQMRLYTATHEGKVIAGTLAIYFGDKVWYLYGASSNSTRNVMPNYLLQWEMIKWAVENKCNIYDFRGVSGEIDESNPLYGLYRFKKGFGGDFTEFVGEMQLVFKPFIAFGVDNLLPLFMKIRKMFMVKR